MNRVMLIIAGVMLLASGAITTAIGVIQSNKENSLDEQAAKLCQSDETLIRSEVTVEGGGLATVYNCQNKEGTQRVVTPDKEDKGFLAAFGVALLGFVMVLGGFVLMIVGLTRRPAQEGAPLSYQVNPAPMTVTTLPGGGATVFTANMMSVNGQPVDPSSDVAQMMQEMMGAMHSLTDLTQKGGALDIGGILQMALQQLDAAHAAGTINEDDYQKARDKIMRNMQQ